MKKEAMELIGTGILVAGIAGIVRLTYLVND